MQWCLQLTTYSVRLHASSPNYIRNGVDAGPRLGLAAEEGELELSCKTLGNAPLTTRERIRRDRELHRLGLNLVERIPKDVLIDLVQVGVSTSLP